MPNGLLFPTNPVNAQSTALLQPDASGLAQSLGQLGGSIYAQGVKEEQQAEQLKKAQMLLDQEKTANEVMSSPEYLALPEALAKRLGTILVSKDETMAKNAQKKLVDTGILATNLINSDEKTRINILKKKSAELLQLGGEANQIEAQEMSRLASLAATDPNAFMFEMREDVLQSGQGEKLLKAFGVGGDDASFSAKTLMYNDGTMVQADNQGGRRVTSPDGSIVTGEAANTVIKAARESGISEQGERSEARRAGELSASLKFQPMVERAIIAARKDAEAKGETLTDLNRANAALPGLREAVGNLKQLAPLATSTISGRAWDTMSREFGFGATKGADARAKFIGIVSNQVLPLLKATFGGSFSVTEGQELKATMGDPNLSPSEKMAQLDAFIEQKVRSIQTKERELGKDVTSTEELLTGEPALPKDTVDNGDGTFTLPDGRIVRRKGG